MFHLYGQNLTISATLFAPTISDNTVRLNVFNESQFNTWEESGNSSGYIISQNLTDKESVSFSLSEETVFHFILQNPVNMTFDATLLFDIRGYFLRFGYENMITCISLCFTGMILICLLGKRTGRVLDRILFSWTMPKYGPLGSAVFDEGEMTLRLNDYANRKRMTKYFLLAFAIMLFYVLVANGISAYTVVTYWEEPIRPEYTILMFDIAFRVFILATFIVAPLVFAIIMLFFVVEPRIGDVNRIILRRLGYRRRTMKHLRITKFTYKRLAKKVFSWPFVSFCVVFVLIFALINQLKLIDSAVTFLFWGVAFAVIVGIWCGFILWSTFYEACNTLNVGKYAFKTYIQMQLVNFSTLCLFSVAFISPFILLAGSESWLQILRGGLFAQTLMLGGESPFKPHIAGLVGAQAILVMILSFSILGVIIFVLFPYIYSEGRKGVSVAIITFSLTYLTEHIFSWIFHRTLTVIQPLALLTPLVAAFVSWIAQKRLQKIAAKLFK